MSKLRQFAGKIKEWIVSCCKVFYFRDIADDPASFLTKDRYKSLKIKIFLLSGILAGVPLIIVTIASYLWLQSNVKEDINNQVKWQLESTSQSIGFLLEEKLSALRFLSATYTYDQVTNKKVLYSLFVNFKNEFGELVDLGIIDAKGIQRSYAGPYQLEGKDYSGQDWFNEATVRGVSVSEVFMGYRKIPHFAIAVRREIPGKNTFWILRAVIDMETLQRYLSTINLKQDDDAFIITREGTLQTPSRSHGRVLEKVILPIPIPQQGVSITEMMMDDQSRFILGYAPIRNSPWFLGAIIKSTAYSKLFGIFRSGLAVFYLVGLLIAIGIIVNLRISFTIVNWIREAEQKREEAIVETEHTGKLASIGRLAAGVAHEINNPLAIINEKAGLMKDILQMSGDFPNKDNFLAQIKAISDSLNRCRTITHRLLGFARRMDVTPIETDINETITEVLGFVEREMLYRNIRLEMNLGDKIPLVLSDKGQLQQVFLNIINNAIDAVNDGGLISIGTELKDQDTVRVTIKDDGAGIPREALKHIFEPFYTTKEKGKGTGLGLSISYGIVTRLGGTIAVETETGKGTSFSIEIPVNKKIA
ncbi:MAG: ATP-binding protein [Nitrospirae bacterium]|nr:ATP-binding protein [Nitrospirota bacterium]